jgi:hypothetical protein
VPVLIKWYVDCIDQAGRAVIGYWSAFAWRGARLSINNVALMEPGTPPRYWRSFSRTPEPEVRGSTFTWRAGTLDWSLTGRALAPPFGLRLLDGADGTVDWECAACPMRADVTLPGGGALSGLGYAERLSISLAPWKLPIEELRWGRWIANAGGRSMVWIDWRGAHPLTAVFVDGARSPSAVVTDGRIAAGDAVLTLPEGPTLLQRSVRDVVGGSGPLSRLLPPAWLNVRDCKRMSPGTFEAAGSPPETGWAIHEHVRFP